VLLSVRPYPDNATKALDGQWFERVSNIVAHLEIEGLMLTWE
jgi:hypothetical protein